MGSLFSLCTSIGQGKGKGDNKLKKKKNRPKEEDKKKKKKPEEDDKKKKRKRKEDDREKIRKPRTDDKKLRETRYKPKEDDKKKKRKPKEDDKKKKRKPKEEDKKKRRKPKEDDKKKKRKPKKDKQKRRKPRDDDKKKKSIREKMESKTKKEDRVLWDTQQEARKTLERATHAAKKAKAKWRKSREKSEKYRHNIYKTDDKKKMKSKSKRSESTSHFSTIENENEKNRRERKLWESVIRVFDMENPDIILLLKASETGLKLSKEAFNERVKLEKKSRVLWDTQQEARKALERATHSAKKAKAKWRKSREKSEKNRHNIKYLNAEDTALTEYKKLKNEAYETERIAEECLSNYQRITELIKHKREEHNERVEEVYAAVTGFRERELNNLHMVKNNIAEVENALEEAIQQKEANYLIMERAVEAAKEATACFVKMEDKVVFSRQEYDKEVQKVSELGKRIEEVDKIEKGLQVDKVEYDKLLFKDKEEVNKVLNNDKITKVETDTEEDTSSEDYTDSEEDAYYEK